MGKVVAALLLGVVIGGIIVVVGLQFVPRECRDFIVYVPNEWGAVAVGNISLCGQGLEWSTISGPVSNRGGVL